MTTLQDLGWKAGATFSRRRGRVTLSGLSPIYKGRTVDFVGITERGVDAYIAPAPREFNLEHVSEIKFTPQELLAFIEEIKGADWARRP